MNIKDKIKEKLGTRVIDWNELAPRRVYIRLNKEDIFEVARILFKELGLRFSIASGVDTTEGFEILYHFAYDQTGEVYSLRVLIEDKKNPKIDSLTPLFSGADWIEREMWEMLGINFTGHPNLTRLLLSEDWPEGNYPLRKTD